MSTITTVIPTYKRPQLLIRAIDSVRSQTWKDIAIVVWDNCSEDATEGLVLDIAKTDPRVTYFKNTENIGAFENFKKGLNNIETEFFSILSDDDYLEPEFYSEAMRHFDQYPDSGFVAFKVNNVDIDGNVLDSGVKGKDDEVTSKYYTSEAGMDAYLKGLLPCIWTGYVFKKDVATSINLGEISEVGYGADILFIWRAASRFNFVVSTYRAANLVSHNQSASSTLVNVFDERFLYWWRNRMLIIMRDPAVSTEIKNKILNYYLTHSTKSFYHFKYYVDAAIVLINRRVKGAEFTELKIDFIAMRSFLPWSILISIKLLVMVLVLLKLDDKSRALKRIIQRAITRVR